MSISVKEVAEEEFGSCAEITFKDTEVLVTLEFGPRIVSVRKKGCAAPVFTKPDTALGRSHGHKMRITLDKSTNGIYCDNSPVRYSPMAEGVRFVQTITEPAQLEVIMDVNFSEDGRMTVEHSVFNKSKEVVKLSIYTETPFEDKGFVFLSQGSVVTADRPTRIMTLWEDCKWSDERLVIGDKYITVHQSENAEKLPRLKLGVNDTRGIAGFVGNDLALVKSYTHSRNALYPFYNCSAFATANSEYLSVQMTSPFYLVEPEESARHIEVWDIVSLKGKASSKDESSIDEIISAANVSADDN